MPELGLPPALVIERVVLLGYMTSGKSTVGKALARRLEWEFLDFDVEIERRAGATVKEVIAAHGEGAFREMEAALTEEVAERPGLVLAPGGGWITRPEQLDRLGRRTLSVWLRVSLDETVRRLNADTIARPFRGHPDPRRAIAGMLAEREPLYRLADVSVPAEGRSPEGVAFEIETIVRTRREVLLPFTLGEDAVSDAAVDELVRD
ncbi:shikimate kinase [Longimicrobium sp.]|uniref:shikimate kinase n=1 Tax=Longimicrobium sp. TaxID=2029185 RepID=UPI002E34D8B6|nr:shikimate kinase [Longimicrobium sp.]HEX6042495.1 shikimate kinase [Longimicrobium sp.]